MRRRLAAGLAITALALAACASAPRATPPSASLSPRPTPTPVGVIEAPTPTPTPTEPLTMAREQVTLTVTPSSTTIAPGAAWSVDVELRNGRDVPLIYGGGRCGFANLTFTLPIPLEPEGKAWTGVEGAFKVFALTQALAPGGVPATDPMRVDVVDTTCPDFGGLFAELAPGESRTQALTWTARLIGGVDPLPGPVDFVVTAGIDPNRTEPPPRPTGDEPVGSWSPVFKALTVSGRLTVEAGSQHPISLGQAVDAVLTDGAFTSWLAAQPEGTCTGVNVFVTSGQAGSLIPPGPNWEIDVFCERGVPRHWLIATVDAFTAAVTGLNRCDVPCDR